MELLQVIATESMCKHHKLNFVSTLGTQQELRKLSGSQDSHTAHKSIQEALDQLQDVVEMVGADKKQVFKWVMNVFGLVSFF